MSKIIGIDLGTTNSCVSVMEAGEVIIIPNAEGARTTPSIVAVKDGERRIGVSAKNQMTTNPDNTIYSAKRFIGRRYGEVSDEIKSVAYKCEKGKNGEVDIVLEGKARRPEEIGAMVLSKLKADAEKFLGQTVEKAVITVPAYFDDSQRQATKDAGAIAGLEVVRIINEPTAAALAYGIDKKGGEKKVVVYDLGGGTFDVSILELDDGVFQVKSTNGDTHLGGDDFDQKVMQWIMAEFKKEQGIDVSSDKLAIQRIKEAAEKAKIELSSLHETTISLPYLTVDSSGPKNFETKLSRAKFEDLIAELVEKTTEPCRKAMKDAKIFESDIDEIILVGGSTRIPLVQEKVKQIFGKDPHQGINPDEVVAMGAAIQGGILAGDSTVKDILLVDVTPLTLGLETLGGVATPLIERNSAIPTSKSQIFSTAADNQPGVEIHVVQGERPMAGDNKSLGKFNLDGIAPAPRGVPQIEVTFDIDSNGILHVKATDKGTGKEQKITISGSSNMSKEEVEKMRQEAEENATEDSKKKDMVETTNKAESLIFQSEKALKDAGEKISAETKQPVEEHIATLKEVLAKPESTKEEIESAYEALNSEIQKIGEELYKAAAPENPEEAGETPADDDGVKVTEKEDIVDAEVVEENEKKEE